MTRIIGTKLPKGIPTADLTSHHLLPDGESKGAGNKQMYNSVKSEIKLCSVLWGCLSVLAKTSRKMQSWRLAAASGVKISPRVASRRPGWHKVLLCTTLWPSNMTFGAKKASQVASTVLMRWRVRWCPRSICSRQLVPAFGISIINRGLEKCERKTCLTEVDGTCLFKVN